jgi:ribonuclease P/MRP protein subunit POP5
MKRLKSTPTLRPKKHYVIFRVHTDNPEFRPDFLNIRGAIWNSLESWLGESGLAKANVKFVMNLWNPQKQSGLLSCNPKYVDHVKVALALVHQIGDERVIIQVLRVSGTIKSGMEKSK